MILNAPLMTLNAPATGVIGVVGGFEGCGELGGVLEGFGLEGGVFGLYVNPDGICDGTITRKYTSRPISTITAGTQVRGDMVEVYRATDDLENTVSDVFVVVLENTDPSVISPNRAKG
jgi:hypothetical protein